jgi:hypothetical protein
VSPISAAEVFDPVSNTWSGTGAMTEARAYHAAAPVAGGRVLVAAGLGTPPVSYDPWTRVVRAEVYDPTSGVWSDAGTTRGRYFFAMAPLPGGGALAAGGGDAPTPSTSEVYDPAINAWTPGPNLLAPHVGHATTALANGEVIVSGGSGASAEVYGEAPQCSDGTDNDGDRLTDFPADRGCSNAADQDETGPDLSAPTATLSATGTLSVPGAARTYRLLPAAARAVPPGTKRTLKLRLAKRVHRAARRALRKGRRVRAKISVRVADAAGNAGTLKRTVRIRP